LKLLNQLIAERIICWQDLTLKKDMAVTFHLSALLAYCMRLALTLKFICEHSTADEIGIQCLPFQLGSKAAPVFVYSQFFFPIFNLLVQP
jgi:hypothetical protein